jgi:hypothetical protein
MARLLRFYGGNPVQWLAELPLGVVRACARMVPRLQAEEAFAGMTVHTGNVPEDAFKATTERWRAALQPIGAKARRRAADPRRLSAIGIGYRRVKATPRKQADGE